MCVCACVHVCVHVPFCFLVTAFPINYSDLKSDRDRSQEVYRMRRGCVCVDVRETCVSSSCACLQGLVLIQRS